MFYYSETSKDYFLTSSISILEDNQGKMISLIERTLLSDWFSKEDSMSVEQVNGDGFCRQK